MMKSGDARTFARSLPRTPWLLAACPRIFWRKLRVKGAEQRVDVRRSWDQRRRISTRLEFTGGGGDLSLAAKRRCFAHWEPTAFE